MKLPRFSLRDLFWLVLVSSVAAFSLPGCAMFHEEPVRMPRGTPTALEDVPEAVRQKYSRLRPGQAQPKVERLENGGYRFESEGHDALYLNEKGDGPFGVI